MWKPAWTCNTCGGCPDVEKCGTSINCPGSGSNNNNKTVLTQIPADTTQTGFYCPSSGCFITNSFLNNNFCDCQECEDEDYWNCTTCGYGCPDQSVTCEFTYCIGGTFGVDVVTCTF